MNSRDHQQRSPLTVAAKLASPKRPEYLQLMQCLMQCLRRRDDLDVNTKAKADQTPLHLLACDEKALDKNCCTGDLCK